jgi:hypothetical protein
MQVNISDEAKTQLKEILGNTDYKEPALRVIITGMG